MRTPLGSIEAHLEAVEDGIRRLDDGTLAVLRGNTARLQRLAEDITAVAQAEEDGLDLRRVPTSALTLVESAAATARNAYAASRVSLDVDSRSTGTVLADPDRMAQVLANLLDNAL
jgi:signal transduction histidine kinase